MSEITHLTASDIVHNVHTSELRVADVADAFLSRIERHDPVIKAYETVNPEMVRQDAAWLDDRIAAGARLPLHGVPVGVKDIIDVAGMPTIAGFEPYRNAIARQDAAIVASLRSAGTLMLGKTHTTQFAVGDPAPTRNPWNLAKSPAGSSAGSGAAVPAGLATLALGSQTAGSMLRPAAFNGAVGFKPTFGWFPLDGVIPLAWSLDHLGLYSPNVVDMELVFTTLTGSKPVRAEAPARIALLTEFIEMSSADVAGHVQSVAATLRAAGMQVIETTLPFTFDLLAAVHQLIMSSEMAAVHSANLEQYREAYGPRIRAGVEVGTLIPATAVLHAHRHRKQLAAQMAAFIAGYDALLLPTVSTEACDREETGDRRFQVPATLLGLPAISLPTGLSSNGLPLATQLIGARGRDREVLAVARKVTEIVPLIGRPDLEQHHS
jgi:Asp-tRNA(Asn)/Glu-tRNA(Gln) amidotransferase A subunit family amidase